MVTLAALSVSITASAQVICIDPGHPSEVGRGATGRSITEVKAAWIVAKRLETLLKSDGYTVVLTKTSELQRVFNKDRAAIANKAKASLMIRLHCDSQKGHGFDMFVPKKPGKHKSKTGPSKSVIEASNRLGKLFHSAFAIQISGQLTDNGLHGDSKTYVGSQYGALIGSIYSQVPVILVEMCRLSDRGDDKFIASTAGQTALAKALRSGVWAAVPRTAGVLK